MLKLQITYWILYSLRCNLQSYERLNLADALIPKTYEDGDLIIKQGDAADGMYFVEAGTVKITIFNEAGKELQVIITVFIKLFVFDP